LGTESTKKRALKILGSRNFSEQEMFKRLTGKGESQEDATQAVKWLSELGYINDSNYASLIVNHYAARGYGEARIKNELFKRGIPREMWDENLSLIENPDFEISDPALEFLSKKLRGSIDKDDLRRAQAALVRRGFSYNDASAAVNRYVSELSDRED